jgi:hypothetical protein
MEPIGRAGEAAGTTCGWTAVTSGHAADKPERENDFRDIFIVPPRAQLMSGSR